MHSAKPSFPARSLKIGTRDSLLAVAQSRLIATALQTAHPGLEIELVPIETRGDRDRKTPLSEVHDTSFFSAELDAALLNGEVDFCVHSVKDLGKERPGEIYQAAIPIRENPRDVIVFRADVIERLKNQAAIRIGSSSARRQFNVEAFLRDALPRFANRTRQTVSPLQFLPLRGSVDDRLRRIHVNPDRPGALDGVVLAIAGLARLWRDADGHRAIAPLLENVRCMVLPLSACPAAPGQGALALECRRGDEHARELLAALHDPATSALVEREFELLATVPESQRSAVGATAIDPPGLGPLMYVRGPGRQGNGLIWNQPPPPRNARAWDGFRMTAAGRHRPLLNMRLHDTEAVFVAHWRAVTESVSLSSDARVWVSGIMSWKQLAQRGHWVEGCADNLGFAGIVPTLECPALGLPALADWTALTHRGAEASWTDSGVGRVLATYETEPSIDEHHVVNFHNEVRSATHFFWGNAGQYQAVKQWLPADANHACGAGKTARALKKSGVDSPQPFPSRKEWRTWLR
jgi:hydroxymethylbilane synthase